MKLQDIRIERRDDLIELVVVGIDRDRNDLRTTTNPICQAAGIIGLDVPGLFGKKMKPVWDAPSATARSTASAVFSPHIFTSVFMRSDLA